LPSLLLPSALTQRHLQRALVHHICARAPTPENPSTQRKHNSHTTLVRRRVRTDKYQIEQRQSDPIIDVSQPSTIRAATTERRWHKSNPTEYAFYSIRWGMIQTHQHSTTYIALHTSEGFETSVTSSRQRRVGWPNRTRVPTPPQCINSGCAQGDSTSTPSPHLRGGGNPSIRSGNSRNGKARAEILSLPKRQNTSSSYACGSTSLQAADDATVD